MIVYRVGWARTFGVNGALVLAVLDQRLGGVTRRYRGREWIFATYLEIGDEVALSSKQTRTALAHLRDRGVVRAMPNPFRGRGSVPWLDATLWWTVDRDRLSAALAGT